MKTMPISPNDVVMTLTNLSKKGIETKVNYVTNRNATLVKGLECVQTGKNGEILYWGSQSSNKGLSVEEVGRFISKIRKAAQNGIGAGLEDLNAVLKTLEGFLFH